MFCCIRNKIPSIWHKRKAKTTTISTPPAPALALALTENHPPTPIGTIPPESPPSYRSSDQQQPTYPLPPISVPSTISTESVNELQPQNRRYGRQFFYPLPPTSVPSTVSSLSGRQDHQEVVAQEPVIEPPTLNTSETDPYARTYVPYTDASPLKNNMFARSTGIYGRVNPDIMSGFGDDGDSIWLVDDEETTEEQSHTPKDPPAQLKTTPSGLSSSHGSAAQSQHPVPTPTPSSSARPAFRYQRPSFLDDEEFTTTSLPNISADSVTISGQKSIPATRRGYAPVAASILNLPGVGVDGGVDHNKNDCSAERDTELPHKRPKIAAAASSSSSSTNLHRNLSEQQDDATAMAYPRQLEQSDNETADEFRFGQRYQKASDSSDVIVTHQRIPRSTAVSTLECVVCADTKDVGGFPRFSITATCTHVSNTCLDCIQLSIESDLNSKLWTEIRCPECRELLEYADIQRYANQQTFAKYETIALRAAMSEAENFIWCTSGCGSGQIHESGSDHPIVTCLHCNHRSCFQHNVAWHETLSCEEYDQLLADPENFRSRLELENERWSEAQRVQLEADMALAQGLIAEDQAEARRREERHRREREQAQMAAQLARKIAARRQREEAKSNATLIRTTKPCTGCGWAIEKNHGCSHMTCIKCRHEFCWGCNKPWAPGHRINCTGIRCKHEFCFECGANHKDIMKSDNSVHEKTCPYHPDNL